MSAFRPDCLCVLGVGVSGKAAAKGRELFDLFLKPERSEVPEEKEGHQLVDDPQKSHEQLKR